MFGQAVLSYGPALPKPYTTTGLVQPTRAPTHPELAAAGPADSVLAGVPEAGSRITPSPLPPRRRPFRGTR